MGINRINPLLKNHAPDAFFTIPITMLSGKRIAIDGNNWMYTNMAIARKKVIRKTDISVSEPNPLEIRREWFLSAITFILGWLSYNITPVFIFDGTHPPEKDETKAKRRDQRIALKAEIDILYEQIRTDTLSCSANIVDQLRKKLLNYNVVSPEDFELFKIVIKGIGIPCLQAVGDGEKLCSVLCIEGKVSGVFSADTDNLVYGCPLVINKFSDICSYDENGFKICHLECVRLDKILFGLSFSYERFVDLCIMSGCDYNKNIPGYAAIKSYKLLQNICSIDNLPRNLNIECLKHIRCRELFKYEPSDNLIINDNIENVISTSSDPPVDFLMIQQESHNFLDVDKRAITIARDYLEMAGVSGQISNIISVYNQITPPTDGLIKDLNFTPINTIHTSNPKVKYLTLNILSHT